MTQTTPLAVKRYPVTFGQLSLLRSIEAIALDRRGVANLPEVWELSASTDLVDVVAAWDVLVELHASLRTTFHHESGAWSQAVSDRCRERIKVVTTHDLGRAEAWRVADELAATPIDVSIGPMWRARVISGPDGPVWLALMVHHAAADFGGMKVLAEDFEALLRGRSPQRGPQPVDLALEQQAASPTGENAFWLEAWDSLEEADRTGGDNGIRERVELYSTAAGGALRRLTARHRLSQQAAVLGAIAIVLFRLARRTRLTVGLMSANRSSVSSARMVTSLNQLVPVTFELDAGKTVAEFLTAAYIDSLTALSNGMYDVDLLKTAAGERGHQHPEPMAFDCHYNFLGTGTPPQTDDPVRDRVVSRPRDLVVLPRFNVSASVDDEGVWLRMMATEGYLNGASCAQTLASIEAVLVAAAADPDVVIGAVGVDALRPLEPIIVDVH